MSLGGVSVLLSGSGHQISPHYLYARRPHPSVIYDYDKETEMSANIIEEHQTE